MSELVCTECPFSIGSDGKRTYCAQDGSCENSVQWLEEHDAKIVADTIDRFKDKLCKSFCNDYCNQEACDGGMIGSIQECETIRVLKDACEDVAEQIKGRANDR